MTSRVRDSNLHTKASGNLAAINAAPRDPLSCRTIPLAADVATISLPNPTPGCSVAETDCCIVGAGPAGVVLGLL